MSAVMSSVPSPEFALHEQPPQRLMSQHTPYYDPVPAEEQEAAHLERLPYRKSRYDLSCPVWVALLFLSNTLTLLATYFVRNNSTMARPSTESSLNTPKVQHLDTTWKTFWWNTPYNAVENRTHTDMLWDAILPSHGLVALDRESAKTQDLPDSMYLPSDHSKGVYLLESYHYLHCLKILRTTLAEALEGKPFTHHLGAHTTHCFGALLQYVVCNADSTPLYTFGQFTAGDGQLHQCRSWSQLREYATENTACFRDSVEGIPLGDHFGYCDDGDDGVID